MKKQLLYLVAFVSFSQAMNAQSISFTSAELTTAVIGTTIQVDYKYTNAADGNIYCAINLLNGWSWVGTVVNNQLSPAPAGTDVIGSFTLTIPPSTSSTSSLPTGQNYKISMELSNSSWSWLAGTYPSTEINLTSNLSVDSVAKEKLNSISLYPNPASEMLNIQNSGNFEIANVKITNLLGELVYGANKAEKGQTIDVSSLASGSYILSVDVDNTKKNMKFIKK